MKKINLAWKVYAEDNGKIEPYDIFEHSGFANTIIELKKEYLDGLAKAKDKASYVLDYRTNIFPQEIDWKLSYYFWAKCEWETVLVQWPTFIEKEEAYRCVKEFEEGRSKYRTTVCLDPAEKIDVYDQVKLNFDVFLDYLWKYWEQDALPQKEQK